MTPIVTPRWPTPDQIAVKHLQGLKLTAWETSVYRLNFRPDGTRYSEDPDTRDQEYADDHRTESECFRLAVQRVCEAHGGRPTCALVDGALVFTYPDGTRTSGGKRI